MSQAGNITVEIFTLTKEFHLCGEVPEHILTAFLKKCKVPFSLEMRVKDLRNAFFRGNVKDLKLLKKKTQELSALITKVPRKKGILEKKTSKNSECADINSFVFVFEIFVKFKIFDFEFEQKIVFDSWLE